MTIYATRASPNQSSCRERVGGTVKSAHLVDVKVAAADKRVVARVNNQRSSDAVNVQSATVSVPPLRREKYISRQLSEPSRVRAGKGAYVGSVLNFSGHREAVSVLHAGSDRALRHSGRSVLPLRPVLE